MWCSTWRQHPVDFAGFLENFSGVIFQRGAFVEMYSDRELPSIHLDDRWRCPKQLCVVREVLHSQSSWHDQKLHRHTFLQRWVEWLKSNTVQDNVIHAVCNSPKSWNAAESLTLFLSGTMRDNSPMRMSVYTLLSWASSMMIALYLWSRKSYETRQREWKTETSRWLKAHTEMFLVSR